MTIKLTLHRDEPDLEDEVILPFPTNGPKQPMRLVREEEESSDGAIPVRSDIAREIEQTLDRMQERLDEFCDQMNDSFPFPSADDDGPDFAA